VGDEKDRKAEPAGAVPKPVVRTVVGVPSLPAAEHAEFTEDEIPTANSAAPPASQAPKAGVVGALPRPATGAPVITPPLGGDLFAGLRPPVGLGRPTEPENPTRMGVAPQPGLAVKGRSTLLLDSSAPPPAELSSDGGVDRPPIVVPGNSAMPPKAVTQPPPWGAGAARVAQGVAPDVPPPRDREPSLEEISAVEDVSGFLQPPAPPLASTPSRPPLPKGASVPPPLPRPNQTLLGISAPSATGSTSVAPTASAAWPSPVAPGAADYAPPAPPLPTEQLPAPLGSTSAARGGRAVADRLRDVVDAAKVALAKAQAMLPAGSALRDRRPAWFLPTIGVAALVVGIGLMGLVISLFRKHADTDDVSAVLSSSAVASSLVVVPAPKPSANPAPSPPTPVNFSPCTLAGASHVVASGAIVGPGVEATRFGDGLALGFAPSDHAAVAVKLDPGALAVTGTAKARSVDAVRRVTPIAKANGALSLVVDIDKKRDRLQGRRTVLADPPVQLGASDEHLAWSHVGGPPVGKLWPLDGPVEALRGASQEDERTLALAFRRGGAVWVGAATAGAELALKGDLFRLEGLGTAVGSPAVAVSSGVVLCTWADRPSSDEPWRLRWARFAAGEAPGAPSAFTPPPGGKGVQAMSPGLSALPGGRFLLVWTEGPASGHAVRALTLASDGSPIGTALAVSNEGVNAGQGQAAVTAGGQGVVAFLESSGKGFEVAATPITCGAR